MMVLRVSSESKGLFTSATRGFPGVGDCREISATFSLASWFSLGSSKGRFLLRMLRVPFFRGEGAGNKEAMVAFAIPPLS